MPRITTLAVLVTLAVSGSASAQDRVPDGWRWVTDAPAAMVTGQEVPDSAWRFVEMAPGWHITMGPGGLLYHPGSEAAGRFTIESEIFLFPGTSNREYGVFLGGRALESAAREYIAFLLRRDGSAAVVQRTPGRDEPLVVWTHEVVAKGSETGVEKNVIRVSVDSTGADFRVNDSMVVRVPLAEDASRGLVGFRVGRGINLHAGTLDVTTHLAPARPRGPGES